MRRAFIEELLSLASEEERIALMVGDLGYSVVEPFAERFPERFINAGVAEQNMMGMAAGMASEGYRVFVYSIANFPTFRCAEQIRNDVAYHRLPVTVVAVGAGLAYGNLGYSHHAVQDYGLLRLLPNMLLAAPGDPLEVRACLRYLIAHPQPAYLRIGKVGEPSLHAEVPEVRPGEWLPVLQRGGNKVLLSTGATLPLARQWLEQPAFADYDLYSLPLWGMEHKQQQAEQVARFAQVVTVEDHLADGGFASWMREALAEQPELMLRHRGRSLSARVCGVVGSQSTLNAYGGLRADGASTEEGV
ncbi:transketolase family protein [Candidatus Magnetaquicoccus inordinatus]|uniref:transketolase family protein n=1 Tax=Candidatus Magnetaquicoccus inordinatus TaxID=2496818 RepID=UPI00102ADB7B|nr:transketolase [Candidatus Magnetaquicoccus inordinatus]